MANSTLPQGLSIVVQQRIRNFEFNLRNTDTLAGDASLHGLYGTSSIDDRGNVSPTVTRKVFPTPFSKPDPEADERKRFANQCMYLPELLKSSGFKVLNSQVEQFYQAAEKQINLLKKHVGHTLPPDKIPIIEGAVNQFALKCNELKIQCARVTRDNPKGSHKRSDGLFSKTTVMRTLYLDQVLTDDLVISLINGLLSEQIMGSTTTAQYVVKGTKDNSVYLEAVVNRVINKV